MVNDYLLASFILVYANRCEQNYDKVLFNRFIKFQGLIYYAGICQPACGPLQYDTWLITFSINFIIIFFCYHVRSSLCNSPKTGTGP